MLFTSVGSPPNCSDLDRGRRIGDRESFQDFIKLAQYFNCIHMTTGYPVEPMDIHPSTRHLDCLFDTLTLTDKVVHAYSLGKERVEDVMEMVRIAGGLTHEEFDASPRMFTNINPSSPLKHDFNMLDGAMRMARRNQPVIVTPFTLAGAMAPVTIAGAVMQQTAEALAMIALLQTINPGAPVVYGSFTTNVDMGSGAPAFGTPEYIRATQISGQMARFYGLPLRASNACAANCPDAQAAWESAFSLWVLPVVRYQHRLSRCRLAGRWSLRQLREVHHGLRNHSADHPLHAADDSRHGGSCFRRHQGSRGRWQFLQRRPHTGSLRNRILQAISE